MNIHLNVDGIHALFSRRLSLWLLKLELNMAPRSLASKLLQAQLNQLSQNPNAPPFQQSQNTFQQPAFAFTQPAPVFSQNNSNPSPAHSCQQQFAFYPCQNTPSVISNGAQHQCVAEPTSPPQPLPSTCGQAPLAITAPTPETGLSDIVESLKDIKDLINSHVTNYKAPQLHAKQLELLENIANRLVTLTSIQETLSLKLEKLVFAL